MSAARTKARNVVRQLVHDFDTVITTLSEHQNWTCVCAECKAHRNVKRRAWEEAREILTTKLYKLRPLRPGRRSKKG